MTEKQEFLVNWLRKAHAMEEQTETLLESQALRLERYPDLRLRFEENADRARRQAARLEHCLVRLGASQSAMQDAVGKIAAVAQDLSAGLADDDIVQGVLSVYANLHYEIGAYRALIETSMAANDDETAAVCRENLREEEAMAEWLTDNLDKVARDFLRMEAMSQTWSS